MNIKSLLIGSAATMVAVSSAQAADAIVVEPEPVEFVRVCDAYGTGFFFIPGTETCIRFGGYVRSAYNKLYTDKTTATAAGDITTNAQRDAFLALNRTVNADDFRSTWEYRARINIDVRNETEWGTLRSQMRFQGTGNEGSQASVDVALISLAGFRAGYGGSQWGANHNFGGVNAEAAEYGFDGFYNGPDAMVFDYTFAAEGFAVVVGIEDLSGGDDFAGTLNSDSSPNFYAGFKYSGDWGDVGFSAHRDADANEITAISYSADQAEWAYKGSIHFDLSEFMPGGGLWGWYMWDGDAQTEYLSTGTNADSIWGVAFQANLTDEMEFWANYWNADGGFVAVDAGNSIFAEEGDQSQWAVGLNWYPSAAPGFQVKAAYMNGSYDQRITQETAAAFASVEDNDYQAFEIILKRNF